MGLRINTNVQSLKAQNVLDQTTKKLNQSLERLSTGLRINTGKDDSVGLSKSESLRAQIRGIDIAKRNISNASSVLGTTEGVLSQLTEIGQQMREVAVQAADGTLSASDRSALTTKFSDLMNEYNRLANNAEFGGVKLVDGTFINKSIQVGPDSTSGNTISISISDARSSAIGQVAVLTGTTKNDVTGNTSTDLDLPSISGVAINGTSLGASSSDGVSNVEASDSAIAYVNAINSISGTTGVTASVNATVFTLDYNSASNALAAATTFSINGVTVKSSTTDGSVNASCDTEAQVFVNLINAKTSTTGVTATIDTTANSITLTASDGRNIHLAIGGGAAGVDVNNALGYAGNYAVSTSQSNAVYRGSFTLQSDSSFTVTGAAAEFAASDSVATAVDSSLALSKASVGDSTSATTAINTLDNVINQLQSRRGTIGSTSNRLDIADAELSSRQENLSAAESRIRDADIAVETAKLTQQQILQQAGVTVLGAANSAPQIALTLLQGLG